MNRTVASLIAIFSLTLLVSCVVTGSPKPLGTSGATTDLEHYHRVLDMSVDIDVAQGALQQVDVNFHYITELSVASDIDSGGDFQIELLGEDRTIMGSTRISRILDRSTEYTGTQTVPFRVPLYASGRSLNVNAVRVKDKATGEIYGEIRLADIPVRVATFYVDQPYEKTAQLKIRTMINDGTIYDVKLVEAAISNTRARPINPRATGQYVMTLLGEEQIKFPVHLPTHIESHGPEGPLGYDRLNGEHYVNLAIPLYRKGRALGTSALVFTETDSGDVIFSVSVAELERPESIQDEGRGDR